MEKITSQKQKIIDYLKNTTSHPTAKEIYLEVKKELPRISMGTVYRILNSLKEKGEIVEIYYDAGHYDANLKPHSHFICINCKRVFDIESPNLKDPRNKNRLKNFLGNFSKVGKIINYQILAYGLCKQCSKFKK